VIRAPHRGEANFIVDAVGGRENVRLGEPVHRDRQLDGRHVARRAARERLPGARAGGRALDAALQALSDRVSVSPVSERPSGPKRPQTLARPERCSRRAACSGPSREPSGRLVGAPPATPFASLRHSRLPPGSRLLRTSGGSAAGDRCSAAKAEVWSQWLGARSRSPGRPPPVARAVRAQAGPDATLTTP